MGWLVLGEPAAGDQARDEEIAGEREHESGKKRYRPGPAKDHEPSPSPAVTP